jgi:carboxypeptidase D
MLDEEDECYYNVSGALMYDPCIGAFDAQDDMYTLEFVTQNNNVLGYNESFLAYLAQLDEECGYAKFKEDYMHYPPAGTQPPLPEPSGKCTSWNDAYNAAYATNPCFNVYMLGFTCPLLADPLGYPTDLQLTYPGLPVYFNRTDVKKAMHAPDIDWLECAAEAVFKGKGGGVYTDSSPGSGGPEGYGDTSPDPIQGVLPRVIESTNRVLM